MVDFHTHVLPGIDDGAESPEVSLGMLLESADQGVDTLVFTPHFYADEQDLISFLNDRADAVYQLKDALRLARKEKPEECTRLAGMRFFAGAEVYYFPSLSTCEEIRKLSFGKAKLLLVEPPVMRWTGSMIDEIENTGYNLGLTPVVAHLDRYMRMLGDFSLPELLEGRDILTQVNASFFTRPETVETARGMLAGGAIDIIGSDCHNTDSRPQNIGYAAGVLRERGLASALDELTEYSNSLLY